MQDYNHHCQSLGNDCRPCRSTYAHIQHEYHYRVENGVEKHGEYRQSHSFLRAARRPHCGVESEIDVGYYIAYENYLHIVPGIADSVGAGSEKSKYGVKKHQRDHRECKTYYYVECNHIAQHLPHSDIVLLP